MEGKDKTMLRRLFSFFFSKSTLTAFSIPWNWFHSLPFCDACFETTWWAAVDGQPGDWSFGHLALERDTSHSQ